MKPDVAKLDALTGLRFLAAFAVFLHHFGSRFDFKLIEGPLGGIAVSFFFVLSGFILTYVYHERMQTVGVRKFYFTRWARIWPLHAVCLLAVFLFFPFQSHVYPAPFEQIKIGTHWLLLQSWVPLNSWVFTFNGVSWSISTEMFFYFMFPLLLLGGQKKFWRKYIGLVAFTFLGLAGVKFLAGVPSVANAIDLRSMVHVSPMFRLLEFGTGMATGFIFLNRSAMRKPRGFWVDSVLEIVSLGLAIGHYWIFRYFGIYQLILNSWWGGEEIKTAMIYSGGGIFFALAVYVFARSNGLLGRLMGCRLMVFLGEVSFAFYMVHQLVLRFVFSTWWVGSTLSPLAAGFGIFTISLGISCMLYLLLEIPMKNALIRLYDRKPKEALLAMLVPAKEFALSKVGMVSCLLVLLPAFFLTAERHEDKAKPGADLIVNRTPPNHREMSLDGNVTLLGWSIEPRRVGIQLNLVWQKNNEENFSRIVHLVGENEKHAVSMEVKNFMAQGWRVGDIYVERIFVSKFRYKSNSSIEIELQPGDSTAPLVHNGIRRVLVNESRMAKADELSSQLKLR